MGPEGIFSLIKVLVVFVLIIVLIIRRMNIGLIMLAGAFLLALLFSVWPLRWLQIAFYSAIDYATVTLLLSLILIQFLEGTLRRSGLLQEMVSALKRLIPDHRIVMAILPAFLGFLPSAGGALFSAPLVEEASKGMEIKAEKKAYINYWFRHIWECVFPIYPGLILASSLLGASLPGIIAHQWYYPLAAICVGSIFAFPGIRNESKDRGSLRVWSEILSLVFTIAPVFLVLILVLVVKLDLVFSLLIVLFLLWLWAFWQKGWRGKDIWTVVSKSFSLNTVFLVLGVMIFKDTLIKSGAVSGLSTFFYSSGIPYLLLVSLLPFFVGVLTGVTQAVVGVTFPLLLGVFGEPISLSLVALGYVSGVMGVMLSPVHLCLVLTKQYFKAEWGGIYRLLTPSALIVLIVAFLFYLL